MLWGPIDFWQPLTFTPEQKTNRRAAYLSSFGRLKPGVSIQQAEQSMVALAANIHQQNSSNEGESLRLEPLHLSMSDDIGRTIMWFTFGLAGFVLLIACVNLANLQLVRTAARSRELAVRAALGAGRWRLLRHSFTESIITGVLLGVVLTALAFTATAGARSAQQDPVSLSPQYYKVLLENDQVRVLEYRLKPGEKEVMHSHPAGVVYGFNESKVRSILPDGKVTESSGKSGDVFWRNPIIHELENIGNTEVHSLAVEIKNPCKR